MEELIGHVFAIRDAAHKAHFSTKSFSQHMALGDFYDQIIDRIDDIVESYQGTFGLVGDIRRIDLNRGEIVNQIKSELVWIMQNREKISKQNSMIENLIDGLMEVYSTTIYKLVNLK